MLLRESYQVDQKVEPLKELWELLLRVVSRVLSQRLSLLGSLPSPLPFSLHLSRLSVAISVAISVSTTTLAMFATFGCVTGEVGGTAVLPLEDTFVITSETLLVCFLQFEVLDVRVKDDNGALFCMSPESQIVVGKELVVGGVGLRRL